MPNPNKKALASELMRQKILNVTIEILGREGYVALTANKLSQQAGISKGALYHHFTNLDDVRRCALISLLNTFVTADDPLAFDNFASYLAANGNRLFTRMKEQPLAMKAMYAFIFQALVDDPLKHQIQQLLTHSLREYKQSIQYFFPTLATPQLDQAVLVLDAYFGGAIFHWFLLDDQAACLASWQLFSDMLLNGLQSRSGA